MKNWGLLPEDLGRLGNILFVHFEGKTRVEMTDMVTYGDPHSVIIDIFIFSGNSGVTVISLIQEIPLKYHLNMSLKKIKSS